MFIATLVRGGRGLPSGSCTIRKSISVIAGFAPLAGPTAGGFISNPAGSSFCNIPSLTLNVMAVRALRSTAEIFSSAIAGVAARSKSATNIPRR